MNSESWCLTELNLLFECVTWTWFSVHNHTFKLTAYICKDCFFCFFCSVSGPQADRIFTGQSITAGRGAWGWDGSSGEAVGWTSHWPPENTQTTESNTTAELSQTICSGWLFSSAPVTSLWIWTDAVWQRVRKDNGESFKLVHCDLTGSRGGETRFWEKRVSFIWLWTLTSAVLLCSFRTRLWDWCQNYRGASSVLCSVIFP